MNRGIFIRKSIFSLVILLILFSCKTAKLSKTIAKKMNTTFYDHQFTGISIYDVTTDKMVYNYNGGKYFTPASNTKIFTLYAGLQLLPDSIPAFKYAIDKDTIFIQGTGDPTLFHPYFKDSTSYNKMKEFKKINLIVDNILDKSFGPGWAWEDFDSYYSAERSAFPMYGNVVSVSKTDSLEVLPEFFKDSLNITEDFYGRDEHQNTFYYKKNQTEEVEIPMVIDSTLYTDLWDYILPNKVVLQKFEEGKDELRTVYSVPSDSVYKRMMEVSDNFLAEQILIVASSMLSDTLSSERVRKHILENQLKDLKQPPYWVDGSGLSRYNLFTPDSFVDVLTRMYQTIPQKRLFNLFSVGGEFGTIKDWYKGTDNPYIYAKTGTLRNNHNLSGYLLTKSGKVLIFSFMNNHYKHSNTKIKTEMQLVFEWLRDNY